MGLIKLTVQLLILCPALTRAGRWFDFRLLRNPGLSTANASNSDACVNSCLQTQGCSAVSYQFSSGLCITSTCNNLDLYKTTGWNTYVLDENAIIESPALPAPQFEWMLTSSCGNANQGMSDGPKMNLYSVQYAPSQSASAGNAPVFAGTATSYGVTDPDIRLSNPLGSSSLSVSMWVKWYSPSHTTLFEYSSASARGLAFWYVYGGMFFNVDSGCSISGCILTDCGPNVNSFNPVSNAWYHFGYVYDGSNGNMTTYMNLSLVAVTNVGFINNIIVWNKAYIAHAMYDTSGTLSGQLYCYKVHKVALTKNQLASLAQSCYVGKIRFSG